jgi:hypothetical protein
MESRHFQPIEDDGRGRRARRWFGSSIGWSLFFGGLAALTIGDFLSNAWRDRRPGVIVWAALDLCGLGMLLTSFWIAIGEQLRRLTQHPKH